MAAWDPDAEIYELHEISPTMISRIFVSGSPWCGVREPARAGRDTTFPLDARVAIEGCEFPDPASHLLAQALRSGPHSRPIS
jgi:hypothetical protein